MREGLRSQVRSGNVSGGGRVGRKERVALKDETFDLGAEGLEEPNLTIEKEDGVENAVKEECDLDLNVSASENVDFTESVSNKSCFSGGDSIVEAGFDRKGKKEQHSNDEVLIGSRVLRSRTMWSDDKRSYKEEDGRVCSMNNRGHGGSERIRVGEEYDEAGEYFSDSYENERTKLKKEEKGERKLKRKRGRPPKMQSKDEDQLVDQSPCKMESKDEEADDERTEVKKEGKDKKKLKRKRGRPPKMQSKDEDQLDDQSPRKMESKDEKADECSSDNYENKRTKVKKEAKGKSKLKRKRGRPPKMKSKDEEAAKYFSDSYENERTKVKKEGNDKSKLKRKRGRPPKMEPKDEAVYVRDSYENERTKMKKEGKGKMTLKRKRGRPPKMGLKNEDQLIDQSPLKCGRAPKAGGQNSPNGFLAMANDKKGKVGLRKGKEGLTMKDGANAIDGTCSGRSPGEELVKKSLSPVKKDKIGKNLETKNNVVGSSSRSNTVSACDAGITARRLAKQFVRDQIMERLSAAGWEVDYRPRNGREYCDAVYVSLDKKTHWSITLAYNRLKKHYEAGDGEGTVYGPGFIFTPIPEEDFNMLTKVVNKTRNDKAKKRGKGGKTVVRVNRKESKGQPGSGSGMRKSVKRKMKMKRSFLKEGNTDVRSSNRMPVLIRDHKHHRTQRKKQCALLVRNAEEEIDSGTDGYVPYSGKRTLLSWMIDLGTVVQDGKVHYMQYKKEHALLDGKITGDGIHCGCCDKIVTISDFEAHAGSKHYDPLKKIYTEGGTSLLQCLLDSWNKQEDSERKGFHFVDVAGEDPNDDTCGVCGDGGDLICCDGCPSTFHQSCLDIKKFPSGDWHCIYCCCKFCGSVGGSSNNMDCSEDFTLSKLLTCHLCEEKYHRSCIESNAVKTDDSWDAFCGNKCQKLSERLEMLLGVKHEIEDGFSWTFIRRSDVGFDASEIETQMVESNSKLAVALSVMDECFMPYIDHKSGINLIHSIMYNRGSNFKRLNYSGFVTAILERGDEIISAASIRIHGNELAEMPFIGTRYMYRRQGMCRRLLNAIEWALSSLNVELLVIPAISELRETWTSVFGFEPLESTNKQIVSNMSLLVFPHVDMLQKNISKDKVADENLIPTEVSNLKKNDTIYNVANNCDGMGSPGSVLIDSTEILPSNVCERNDKTMSSESSCRLLKGSNKASDITGITMHTNSPKDVICQVVCQTGHENLAVKDKSAANACDYATDTHCVAEDVIACRNISCDCVILNHSDKPIDLGSQLNKCCIPSEGRKCLSLYCSGTEATEGHDAGALLEVSKMFPIEVKVDEIVTNNNRAENAAPCGAESIHLDLHIVCSTSEPKDSADGICHDSDNNGMRSKNRSVQPDFVASEEVHVENCGSHSGPDGDCASGEAVLTTKDLPLDCEKVSIVNAQNVDEPELSLARTGLETNIYPADCQSMPVSSGICEKYAGGVSESSKASGVVEADLLPADTDKVSDSKPCMKGSSELAESDLQIEQSARSNVPYLRSPNTASGAAILCASAGSTSCGSTEGIVLSNQAS